MPSALYRRVFALAVLLVASAPVPAQSLHKVTRIVDGDTVVLAELGTVRLIGVDTQETVNSRKPVEDLGRQSTAFLTGLVLGKTVRVEYDQTRKDRFNRTLTYLYLADGTLVNREIVRLGYGQAYAAYPFKFLDDFRAAGREAQAGRLGLWAAGLGDSAVKSAKTTTTAAADSTATETVFVTKTGTKYHRDGCRFLTKSRIPVALKEAAARYGACSICRPPTLSAALQTTTGGSPTPPATRSAPTSRQCAATTKAGARCKRNASPGSSYCWQHGAIH